MTPDPSMAVVVVAVVDILYLFGSAAFPGHYGLSVSAVGGRSCYRILRGRDLDLITLRNGHLPVQRFQSCRRGCYRSAPLSELRKAVVTNQNRWRLRKCSHLEIMFSQHEM